MFSKLLGEVLRYLKNKIGSFMGYGGCPNCGNSWWWIQSGSITYASGDIKCQQIITGDGSGEVIDKIPVILPTTSGVLICRDCLDRPEKLESQKIKDDLIRYHWPERKAEAVRQAVIVYKNRQKEIELVNAS